MKSIRELMVSNKMSTERAEKIAKSQFDLGLVSQAGMVIALSARELDDRVKAYEQLDKLSQFIVYNVLDCDFTELNGIRDHFAYIIRCLSAAREAQ